MGDSVGPVPAFAGTRTTTFFSTITIDPTASSYSFGYPYPQVLPTSYSTFITTIVLNEAPPTTISLPIAYLVLTEVDGIAVYPNGTPVITHTIEQQAPPNFLSTTGGGSTSSTTTTTQDSTVVETLTVTTPSPGSGSPTLATSTLTSTQTTSTPDSTSTADPGRASGAPTTVPSPNATSNSNCSGFTCWPTGKKVGTIVGILIAGIAIIAVLWWGLVHKRRSKQRKTSMHSERDLELGSRSRSHGNAERSRNEKSSRRGPQPSWAGRASSSSSEEFRIRSGGEEMREKRGADHVDGVARAMGGRSSSERRRRESRGKRRDESPRGTKHNETRNRTTGDEIDRRGRGRGRNSSHSPTRGHSDHKHDNKRSKSNEPEQKEKSRLWGILPLALTALYTLCEPKGGGWDQYLSEEKKAKDKVKEFGRKIGDEIIDRHHKHQKKKRHSQNTSPESSNNHAADGAHGKHKPRAHSAHTRHHRDDGEPSRHRHRRHRKDDDEPGSSRRNDRNKPPLHHRSSSYSPPAPRKRMSRSDARAKDQDSTGDWIQAQFRERYGSSSGSVSESMLSSEMQETLKRERKAAIERRDARRRAAEGETAKPSPVAASRKVEDDFSFRGPYADLKMSPSPKFGVGNLK